MFKNVFFCFIMVLFLSACATNNQSVTRVNEVIKIQTQCYNPKKPLPYEVKVNGLTYISDVGFKYCINKRTVDSDVALKKVYIHRIYDLDEKKKFSTSVNKAYYIDAKFNYYFYIFLKEELENRGIVVVEDTQDSPYVLKVDLTFTDFYSNFDANSLYSVVNSSLLLKDINTNKKLNVKTMQEVKGFYNIKDLPFFTQLLIRQVANKAAQIISEL